MSEDGCCASIVSYPFALNVKGCEPSAMIIPATFVLASANDAVIPDSIITFSLFEFFIHHI